MICDDCETICTNLVMIEMIYSKFWNDWTYLQRFLTIMNDHENIEMVYTSLKAYKSGLRTDIEVTTRTWMYISSLKQRILRKHFDIA